MLTSLDEIAVNVILKSVCEGELHPWKRVSVYRLLKKALLRYLLSSEEHHLQCFFSCFKSKKARWRPGKCDR